MSNQPKPIFPEPKIIRRLSMWAPDPASTSMERANMTFGEKGPNLEILVWTRAPADKGKAPIRANLSLLQIGFLCEMLERVADSAEKCHMDLPLKNGRSVEGDDGKKKTEVYDQGIIRVAKNSEGMVLIGVFDQDDTRSRILFPFALDRWTGIIKQNGDPMTESAVSSMVAKNYARILRERSIANAEVTSREEDSQRYGDRKEGGGGKKSYGNKDYQKSNNDSFDDLTF